MVNPIFCGCSVKKLLQDGISDNQIIFIDFEDFDNSRFTDVNILNDFIKSTSAKVDNKRLYLLFDEIQELVGWERLVNSLYSSDSMDCDIYLTGSNAKLLSSELATYISGRYVLIPIFPLSYGEFLEFSEQEDSATAFVDFMRYGGFPGLRTITRKKIPYAHISTAFTPQFY